MQTTGANSSTQSSLVWTQLGDVWLWKTREASCCNESWRQGSGGLCAGINMLETVFHRPVSNSWLLNLLFLLTFYLRLLWELKAVMLICWLVVFTKRAIRSACPRGVPRRYCGCLRFAELVFLWRKVLSPQMSCLLLVPGSAAISISHMHAQECILQYYHNHACVCGYHCVANPSTHSNDCNY